jgi:hypothetical protein
MELKANALWAGNMEGADFHPLNRLAGLPPVKLADDARQAS